MVMAPPSGLRVTKGSSRRAHRTDESQHPLDFLSADAFGGGVDEEAYLRYKLFQGIWETVQGQVKVMEHQEDKQVVQQVSEFLYTFSTSKSAGRHRSVIPIASITTGMVRGENTAVFNAIRLQLEVKVKCYFVRIDTSTKPTVKIILQNIMEQLSKQNFKSTATTATSDPETTPNGKHLLDRYTVHPLVLMFEDVEQLDSNVLQDFLRLICSGRYKEYSVQLIFGSPHGLHCWQEVIPHEVESSFLHKQFYTVHPEQRLACFWEIILSFPIPFKLSGHIVKYCQDYYRETHCSISRLLQIYHLCLLRHFTRHRNALCIGLGWFQKIFGDSKIIKLASYKPEDLGLDDKTLKEIATYTSQARLWSGIVHLLFELSKNLPSNPLGTNLADVYILTWDKNMFSNDPRQQTDDDKTPFLEFLRQISFLPYPDIKLRLQNGLQSLRKYKSNEETDSDSELNVICGEIQSLLVQDIEKSPEKKPSSSVRSARSGGPVLREMSAAEFKEQRLAHFHETTKKANVFVTKVKNFVRNLQKMLNPLHKDSHSEAFVFDDVKWVKEMVVPMTQKNLHMDLLATYKFPKEELRIQLDTSCLYMFVTEQPVVNMNVDDLFQAFTAVLEGSANPDENETDQEHMLFRMRQALIELEILGIFKSNKRNGDLVTRQMWYFDH